MKSGKGMSELQRQVDLYAKGNYGFSDHVDFFLARAEIELFLDDLTDGLRAASKTEKSLTSEQNCYYLGLLLLCNEAILPNPNLETEKLDEIISNLSRAQSLDAFRTILSEQFGAGFKSPLLDLTDKVCSAIDGALLKKPSVDDEIFCKDPIFPRLAALYYLYQTRMKESSVVQPLGDEKIPTSGGNTAGYKINNQSDIDIDKNQIKGNPFNGETINNQRSQEMDSVHNNVRNYSLDSNNSLFMNTFKQAETGASNSSVKKKNSFQDLANSESYNRLKTSSINSNEQPPENIKICEELNLNKSFGYMGISRGGAFDPVIDKKYDSGALNNSDLINSRNDYTNQANVNDSIVNYLSESPKRNTFAEDQSKQYNRRISYSTDSFNKFPSIDPNTKKQISQSRIVKESHPENYDSIRNTNSVFESSNQNYINQTSEESENPKIINNINDSHFVHQPIYDDGRSKNHQIPNPDPDDRRYKDQVSWVANENKKIFTSTKKMKSYLDLLRSKGFTYVDKPLLIHLVGELHCLYLIGCCRNSKLSTKRADEFQKALEDKCADFFTTPGEKTCKGLFDSLLCYTDQRFGASVHKLRKKYDNLNRYNCLHNPNAPVIDPYEKTAMDLLNFFAKKSNADLISKGLEVCNRDLPETIANSFVNSSKWCQYDGHRGNFDKWYKRGPTQLEYAQNAMRNPIFSSSQKTVVPVQATSYPIYAAGSISYTIHTNPSA